MTKKRNKKKPRNPSSPAEEKEEPSRGARRIVLPRQGGFFWGLSLGFLVTLGLIVSGDLGVQVLPAGLGESHADARTSPNRRESEGFLYLAGTLPPGAHVYVDGAPADPVLLDSGGLRVPAGRGARKLEVRGADGTWWSTRLTGTPGDTLRPMLGGEIVVEVQRQGPTGTLFLDGVPVGEAPGSVGEADPGWHVFSIRDGETVLYEDACEVKPGEVTVVTVPPVPPRGKGRLVVRARELGDKGFEERNGSPVWVDGEPAGETPLSITLSAGFHSVRVGSAHAGHLVEVVNLEAGASRYVNAEFGREDRLWVQVAPPSRAGAESPLAIPVQVLSREESVLLEEGFLYVVKPDQAKALGVPLVPSGTDPDLWVAVIPRDLTSGSNTLTGYASCLDDMGRRGESELFRLSLH